MVFCPHLNSAFMDGIATDLVFLKAYCEVIRRMTPDDLMVMLPGWNMSSGARREHGLALQFHIPITYHHDEEE